MPARALQTENASADAKSIAARRAVMALCAEATGEELRAVVAAFGESPGAIDMRPVERGLAMLRGRMGGDGRPFNLGEASVTRAAIALPDGAWSDELTGETIRGGRVRAGDLLARFPVAILSRGG